MKKYARGNRNDNHVHAWLEGNTPPGTARVERNKTLDTSR